MCHEPFRFTSTIPLGVLGTPWEQPAPASSAYILPLRNATSATPLISGEGIGAV